MHVNSRRTVDDAPLREYALVTGIVVALHVGLLYWWLGRDEVARLPESESVVAVQLIAEHPRQAVTAESEPEPAKPEPKKEAVRRDPLAERSVAQPERSPAAAESDAQPVQAAAPVVMPEAPSVPDVEPDYKAAYLNNPRPPYPMTARRLGLQGKVVLNVEVLAEGVCGRLNVSRSSGYEMLDNAALRTVKAWRFVPARHGDQAVTRWFQVPIKFSLGDSET